MYSSKPLTKWSGASFLSSSEPYRTKSEIERKTIDSRFKGRQFRCNPTKRGRDGLFTTMKVWKYKNPNHIVPKEREKREKSTIRAFGIGEEVDRTKLLNQISQQQWNERIKSERKYIRSRSSPNLLKVNNVKKTNKKRKRSSSGIPKRRQYDIAHDTTHVFAKERYKKYKRPITADPRTSSYIYTSSINHYNSNKTSKISQKSKHVRTNKTKEFYTRNRHLSICHPLHRQINTALYS